MEQELITALSNVNINSETAEAIAREYFRFKYIEMITSAVLLFALLGGVGAFLYKLMRDCD